MRLTTIGYFMALSASIWAMLVPIHIMSQKIRPSEPLLKQVTAINHDIRNAVSIYMREADWTSPPSLYKYGLKSKKVLSMVNRPMERRLPIVHDLISLFGAHLQAERPVKYLEIGVSVGKNLYTQLNFLRRDATIFALDVENINPSLEELLSKPVLIDEWSNETLREGVNTTRRTEMAVSTGHGNDTIKRYTLKKNLGPTLTYVASDEFSEDGWIRIYNQGVSFNMVLSDALHTGQAVAFEFQQLLKYNLLDTSAGFVMFWDDCNDKKGVLSSVRGIQASWRERFPQQSWRLGTFRVHGWLGDKEPPHDVCYATSLDLQKMLIRDPELKQMVLTMN